MNPEYINVKCVFVLVKETRRDVCQGGGPRVFTTNVCFSEKRNELDKIAEKKNEETKDINEPRLKEVNRWRVEILATPAGLEQIKRNEAAITERLEELARDTANLQGMLDLV